MQPASSATKRFIGSTGKAMTLPRGLATVLLLSLGLTRLALATDGLEPIGISVQSLIRGGSDVAIGDSALSQIDNPATLILLPKSVDVSGELLMPSTRWRGVYDTADSSGRALPLGHAAVALPWKDRFAFGLAVWSKNQLDTDFHIRSVSAPYQRQHTYGNMRDFGFGPSVAVRVTDALSIGAGVRLELVTGEFTSLAGPEQVHFGRGYGLGAGYQLGLHYRLAPGLTFGLGYRSPTWFQDLFGSHTSSSLTNDWEISSPGIHAVHSGRALIDHMTLPQKVSAGLAWQVTGRLRLSTEARWINYENSSLYRAKYDLSSLARSKLPSLIGYRDVWAIMAGAEYKLTDHWTAGGGYHFASNPISGRAFLPIADMICVHHLTTGLTYRKGHWWFGGGYVLGLPNTLAASYRTRILLGLDSISGEIHQVQHSVFLGGGYRW
jgi:long-subunit fatty acid transport protein